MAESTKSLAERIRLYRQANEETQQQLADRLGISRGTLINWEKGEFPPGLGKLVEEMYEAEKTAGQTYQLKLPFEQPIDLEVRISPRRATAIRLDVERRMG